MGTTMTTHVDVHILGAHCEHSHGAVGVGLQLSTTEQQSSINLCLHARRREVSVPHVLARVEAGGISAGCVGRKMRTISLSTPEACL
jgi:hypothetical protein